LSYLDCDVEKAAGPVLLSFPSKDRFRCLYVLNLHMIAVTRTQLGYTRTDIQRLSLTCSKTLTMRCFH